MPYLPFISDEQLKKQVEFVLNARAIAFKAPLDTLFSNSIDPFSALFDAKAQGIDCHEWLTGERTRQVQKSLQNAIGTFHQEVIGNLYGGWEVLPEGLDVLNKERQIVAEIKNKHNTMNSGSATAVYDKMKEWVESPDKAFGFTAYLVQIISSGGREYDMLWSPSLKKRPLHKSIRVIDGRQFYALATGDRDALKKLFDALPTVIDEVLSEGISGTLTPEEQSLLNKEASETDTVHEEQEKYIAFPTEQTAIQAAPMKVETFDSLFDRAYRPSSA